MAKVKLPDGNTLESADGTTVKEFAEQIGPGLAKAALAARIDGELVDLSKPISGDVGGLRSVETGLTGGHRH